MAWTRRDVEAALAGPRPSLNGADLRQLDLTGMVLTGVDLSYAQLSSALLCEADLSRAILFAAQAQGACLRGADLRGANLTAADFSRTDLRDARLQGADLSGTDLTGALFDPLPELAASGAIRRTTEAPEISVDPSTLTDPIFIRVGDILRVEMAEPEATGFSWAITETAAAVLDPIDTGLRKPSAGIGGEQRRTFRFRARQAGRDTLVLELRRDTDPQERGRVRTRVLVEPT